MLDIESDPIHQVSNKCVYPIEDFDGLGMPMLLMKVSHVKKEPLEEDNNADSEHRVLDNELFDQLFAKVESHRTPVKRKSVQKTQKKRKSSKSSP